MEGWEFYHSILSYLFPALIFVAAIGLFRNGGRWLGVILGATVIARLIGWQYLLNSGEAPGFAENLSAEYYLATAVVDISVLVEALVVLVVCWQFFSPQPNQ
jgi:hypothetical protein